MITVASDAGGRTAVEPWIQAASPTHLSLLDCDLTVTNLYCVRNVPTAFWIDESGRIVRAHDPIYALRRDSVTHNASRNERYLDAVRDWVANGAASGFLLDEVALGKRRRAHSLADVEAEASFELGVYLAHHGDLTGAQPHFDRAGQLAPDNWTFRRQAWRLEGADRETILKATRDPSAPPFYPELELSE